MKTYTTDHLSQIEPELFEKIKEAHELVIPEISDHVSKTIFNSPLGSIAVHATFLRIVNEKTNEIFFIELQTSFIKTIDNVLYNLKTVCLYDDFEEYEESRQQGIKDSVRKNANENFPTFQNFDGKNVGKIF